MLRKILFFVVLLCPVASYAGGLYVCNESGEVISVAYARNENNKWAASGWTNVAVNRCYSFTNNFTNTRYYILAKGASGKIWGGNHYFCASDGGFSYPDANNVPGCTQKGFFSVWVPDMVTGQYQDHYAVVIGPNNQNLNHPRAER
jgi:uncharacterized membrane protein